MIRFFGSGVPTPPPFRQPPRCPSCRDWVTTRHGAPGGPLCCPRCGRWFEAVVLSGGRMLARPAQGRDGGKRGRG